jgi:hypothetical protein
MNRQCAAPDARNSAQKKKYFFFPRTEIINISDAGVPPDRRPAAAGI